ncbi:hypothetical protein Poli38472_004695 [Pythium oligandrum]|uniref:Glucanase n=1 Tax=Pythium oligandrum TaxID=41045 RepID=A0A8K1FEN8_PYTOL|nr:hypothetical protein Poli38472_004695 [Pythium oligandrum]|eukprot:TMW59626.1 hypothetical protein Poli38472_004695 [Pythium oligandrum]
MRTACQLLAAAFAAHASSATAYGALDCKSSLTGSYAQAVQTYPHLKNAISMVASQSIGVWYTDRQTNTAESTRSFFLPKCEGSVNQASQNQGIASQRPTIVVYGLPQKDCEHGFSTAGSNKNSDDYRAFLNLLAEASQNQPVIYILEPDAIGLLAKNGCGNSNNYAANLALALDVLGANPNADIYLDIGYWTVMSDDGAAEVAEVVKKVDTSGRCKGIALDTSNYRSVKEMATSCERFARVSGKNYHCIVDTSRNYVPPASNEWCNAKNTGIGQLPTANTGHDLIDHFVWVKPPGESDGECSGQTSDSLPGPSAGSFFTEHFVQLWNNGVFVQELGQAPLSVNPGVQDVVVNVTDSASNTTPPSVVSEATQQVPVTVNSSDRDDFFTTSDVVSDSNESSPSDTPTPVAQDREYDDSVEGPSVHVEYPVETQEPSYQDGLETSDYTTPTEAPKHKACQ